MEHQVLLLLLLVVVASAGPLASRHNGRGGCAGHCTKPELPPAYKSGRAYTFDYSTDMRTFIRGASEEPTGLRLTAKAVFDFLTPCEVALRLESVRVMELDPDQSGRWLDSPHQSHFASELVMSDTHFAITNGVVSEVCAEVDEPEWALNIKKAVISLIQNTNTKNLDTYEGVETDISGECKVAYNVQRDNSATASGTRVTKVTDLMSCLDQQKVRSSFQSSSYRATARIQSMPLTKANRTCRAEYNGMGQLKSAQCFEEHVFRPFSTDNAGAVTSVDQRMTLVGEGGIIRIAHDHRYRRSKLEYQHHSYKLPSEHPVENVKAILSGLCDLGSAIVPKTPVLFNELVYRLRELSADQLAAIRTDVERHAVCRRNNQMAKQFFFDALPAVTTAPVAQLMTELIVGGQISTSEADAWLTSLAFVQEPNGKMLQSLLPLLEVDKPRTQALLGVTALVNQYCKSNLECREELVVQSVGAALKKLIGSDCLKGNRKTTLIALKAVGNAGHLTELLPTVAQCAMKDSNPVEVRVAAIESLRRTPCTVGREPLMTLIKNMDLDSELRITAYLGLMTCPTIELFQKIKELLTAESSNQFASFVWTHLTNLLETSDPHKQDVRLIVEDVKLKKQFDMDKLKYSRNIEKSFFANYLNAGAKLESNLIWSQQSFLPRSITLNMTLDLFGKSLNFLEIGGRAQGLEVLLEKYLGPKANSSSEKDTKGQLAQLDSTFKLIEEKIGGNLDIKIFGHQIAFFDLWKEDLEKGGKNVFEMLNSLKQIREVNWYKSIAFLDTQVTIPTISGFPLRIGVNGTASFILKASSKINMKKLMQWPPEFEMEGKLVPSGVVHVGGMMGISTIFGDYGVKMVSNVYSNTEMQATIKTAKGEELQIEIQQPRERQNILSAKTSFFVVHRSVERDQSMRRDLGISQKRCSGGGVLDELLGVEFCSEIRYPSAETEASKASLATGFELDVAMFKRDQHTSYILHLLNKRDRNSRHLKALVDMPGSTRDRKLQLEFKLDPENKMLQGVLSTPWKKGKTELSVGPEGIYLLAEVDGVPYVSAKANYRLSETSDLVRMELEGVEIRLLGSRPIKMQGAYGYSKLPSRKSWELSGKVENLLTKPVAFETSIKYSDGKAAAKINLESPIFTGKLDSDYSVNGSTLVGSTLATYQIGENAEQSVKIEPTAKLNMMSNGHNFRSSVKLTFSEVPEYNTHMSILFKRSDYFNHEVDLTWENGLNGQQKQRRVYSMYDMVRTPSRKEHKLSAFMSDMNGKYGVESALKHDQAWSQIVSSLVLSSGTEKVTTDFDFAREPGTLFYTATIKSDSIGELVSKLQRFPDKGSVVFESTVSIIDADYSVKAELLQKDTLHKVSGHLSIPEIANVAAELTVDSSTSEPSLSAKITIPTATYSANATAKFEDEKIAIAANISGPGVAMQTKLQLSSDEEMKKLLAEFYWDPRRQQADGFMVEGSFQTVRKAHSLERIGRLEVSTPKGAVAIRLNERNEPLKSNKYIELEYGNRKKVSANFMYDINDGWTEKGIVAMLRLVTPLRRYEDITLKLDGYGSLRIRKLEIESIINERRFKADLLVNLGNINNFHSRLSIVTPWAHASFIKFELNHWLTSSEIKSKLDTEFMTKKIILDVHGYNQGSYGSRDIGIKLQTDSSLKWMPKLLLDLAHKNDLKQFTSRANVSWGSAKQITATSDFNFYLSEDGVESRGNISLGTPFDKYKALSVVWNHKNNRQIVKTSSNVMYKPGKEISFAFEGYDEVTQSHGDRQMAASLVINSPFMEEFKVRLGVKGGSKFETTGEAKVPFVGTYQVDMLASDSGPRMHVKVDTPHAFLPRFGMIHSQRKDGDQESSSNSELYWNDQVIKLTSKYLNARASGMLEFVLQTPFEVVRRERLLLQLSEEETLQKVALEFSHKSDKLVAATLSRQHLDDKWDYRFTVETPFDSLKSAKISGLCVWKDNEKSVKASLVYNDIHTVTMDTSASVLDNELNAIFDVLFQGASESKGIKITHKRTAELITTQLSLNAGSQRKLSIKNVIRSNGVFELESTTPWKALSSSKLQLFKTREGSENRMGIIVKHNFFNEVYMLDIQGSCQGYKKAQMELAVHLPRYMQSGWKLILNHRLTETAKWETSAKLLHGEKQCSFNSELSVASNEIIGKWMVKTPFDAIKELSLQLQQKTIGRLMEHLHMFKMSSGDIQIQTTSTLQYSGLRSVKVLAKFESNIPGYESVVLQARQAIETSPVMYELAYSVESPITLTVAGGLALKIEASGIEGSANFQSPSNTLKNLNVTVQLSLTDWLYWTMKSKVQARNDKGTFLFEKELAVRGLKTTTASFRLKRYEASMSGSLKVEALRTGTVLIKGAFDNNNEKSEVSIKIEQLNANQLKATFQISGLPVLVAESELKTTEGYETIGHIVSISSNENLIFRNNLQLAQSSSRGNKFALKVSTKALEYTQDTSFEFEMTPSKLGLNASHSCSMIRGPISFKFDAERRMQLAYLSANARLDSPYFDPITATFLLNIEHILKGIAEFDLRLPNIDRICYGVTWDFLTTMVGSISVELPLIGSIEGKIVTEGEELVAKLEIPKILPDKWELRAGGTVESLDKVNLKFKLSTSLPRLKDVSIQHMHNFQDDNQLNTEVSLPGWTKKAKIHMSVSQNKLTVIVDGPELDPFWGELFLSNEGVIHEMKLAARWKPIFGDHDLELRTKVIKAMPTLGSLDFKLPLKIFGTTDALRVKFDGDLKTDSTNAFSADLQYAASTDHPMSRILKVTYGIQSGKSALNVNLPSVPASVQISRVNKEAMARITVGGASLDLNLRTELNSVNDFEIVMSAKSSGPWVKQAEFHLRHLGNWRQFENKMSFKVDLVSVFDYSGKIDTADGALKAEFDVETPKTDRMSLRVGHLGQLNDFTHYMEVKSKYHAPLMYKGSYKNNVGDFSSSLPILGEASMQMRRVGGKSIVSVYTNKDRKVKFEVENGWDGTNGKSSIKVSAMRHTVCITLANEGSSWKQFKSNFTVRVNDNEFEMSAGHKLNQAADFSVQFARPENNKKPIHLISMSYRRSEKIYLQLVHNYETLFGIDAKLDRSTFESESASLIVQTKFQGLRFTSLTAYLTSDGSSVVWNFKLSNDYTGENSVRFENPDMHTAKVVFESSYLGKYSIILRDRSNVSQTKSNGLTIAIHPEIELLLHGLKPIQLKLDLDYSPSKVLYVAAHLATSFEGLTNSRISLRCHRNSNEQSVSLTVSQDFIGEHGVSGSFNSGPEKWKGEVKIASAFDAIGGATLTMNRERNQFEITFTHNSIGAVQFKGKVETKDEAVKGNFRLLTPWKIVGSSSIGFEWRLGSEEGTKLELNLKTPLLGENRFALIKTGKEVSDSEIQSNLHITLYLEKLQERFSLHSTFTSRMEASSITASGSHSLQCSRLGVYSIAEKVQINHGKIYATTAVRTPITDWDKTVLTFDLETIDKTQFTIQLDTKLYGMQDLTFKLSENEFSGHLTVLSIRNDLTITGWQPKTDSKGARFLDLFVSVSSPFMRSSGRVNLKQGHFSASTSFSMQSKSATAATTASWEFKPQRILLDLGTNFHMGDFSQVWSAVCDLDFANKTAKRMVLKLVAPIEAIGSTEFAVTLKTDPLIETSVSFQSPNFGHVRVRSTLHAANGVLAAPVSGKLRFEHDFRFFPQFEVTLDHIQRHENVISDFKVRNLKTGNLVFKADGVLDAFNKKLQVNIGVNHEVSIKWQSQSDFDVQKLDEHISLLWNQKDEFSVKAVYNWRAARTIGFKVGTPFPGYEKLGAKLVASISMPFDVTVKVMLPSQEIKAQAVLDTSEGLHVRGALKLPYLPEVELAFQAAGSLNKYKFEVTAQYGTKRFSAMTNWDMQQDAKFRIKLETPVTNLRVAEFSFDISSTESTRNIKIAIAYNKYANELTLMKESNSRGLNFRIHYPGRLIEVKVNRLGHNTNRALNFVFNLDDTCLIDISTRATSMFSSKRWIRIPHSGFLEVKKLFGTVLEQSKLEWSYKNVRYSISGVHDLSALLQVHHKDSYFKYEMAMHHGGKFTFKTSVNVPRYGVRLDEVTGTVQISSYNNRDTRIVIELAANARKLQLVCSTNWRDNIAIHLGGLKGAAWFADRDSLALQAHYIRSTSMNEISVKISGLHYGDVRLELSLKRDKEHNRLSISMEAFKKTLDGHLLIKSHRGWLSSVKDHKLEGRLSMHCPTSGSYSVTWSARMEHDTLEADVAVVSGMLSDNKLLQSKIAISYNKGLHANVEVTGFGIRGQMIAALIGSQLNLLIKNGGAELASAILSYERTGYRTVTYKQRFHALYKQKVVFGLESTQEVVNWPTQVLATANLEVAGQVYLRNLKLERKDRTLNAEIDCHTLKPIKVVVDLESILKPKVHVSFGSHEVLTHMMLDLKDNTLNAAFDTANPWMPLKVRLNHEHRQNYHKVMHEYVIGHRAYTIDGSAILGRNSLNAKLNCKSPTKSLALSAHAAHGPTLSTFSHTVTYNDVNYLQVDGNMQKIPSSQQQYQTMRTASIQVSTGQHQYTRFLPPVKMEMQHHYNMDGWKDSAWAHKLSIGEWKASHIGHIDWKNYAVGSRFDALGHADELKVGNGAYAWQHTSGSVNVGAMSGTYSKKSSSLKFNSDLTSFHTNSQFEHNLSRRMGSLAFAQTGSFLTPRVSADWNLNRPTLRGEFKIGKASINLEHVHNSNKDFSCHYKYKYDSIEHSFITKFALKPSTRKDFHTEVEAQAELKSSLLPQMFLKLHHHHNSLLEHRCAGKVHFADWKMLHTSTFGIPSQHLEAETYIHRGEVALFSKKLSYQDAVLSAESQLGNTNLYKILYHHTPEVTSVKLTSGMWNIDTTTTVEHKVAGWHQGTIQASHSGLLPRFESSASWHAIQSSRRIYAKLLGSGKTLEIDLNSHGEKEQFQFSYKVNSWLGDLHTSGRYDSRSLVRLTDATLWAKQKWQARSETYTWAHKLGPTGFVKMACSDELESLIDVRTNWDFSSLKKSFDIYIPQAQLRFKQTSPTSGQFSAELAQPSGKHSVAGFLDASSNWKTVQMMLNSSGSIYSGSWNLEGESKTFVFNLNSFQMNSQLNQREMQKFNFTHKMLCHECPLSNLLPRSFATSGKMDASAAFLTGTLAASYAVNGGSPIAAKAAWNFANEEKVVELMAPMVTGRLSHRHASITDFNFKHSLTVLSKTHTATGGFKIEPSAEFGRRIAAYVRTQNCGLNFEHHHDGHMHKWNHTAHFGHKRFSATGHRYPQDSFASEVSLTSTDTGEQHFNKNFIWNADHLEYADAAGGIKYHYLKVVNTNAEKAAWFKSRYYEKIVGAGLSLKKTCVSCFRLEIKAASKSNPKLVDVASEVRLDDYVPTDVNCQIETPLGQITLRSQIQSLKLASIKYIGSVKTNAGNLRLEFESYLPTVANASISFAVLHSDLLPVPNIQASLALKHRALSGPNFEQSIQVRVGNEIPFIYSLTHQLVGDKRKTVLSVRWMPKSFVEAEFVGPLHLTVRSSCPVVPVMVINVQPKDDGLDIELRLAEKTLKGSLRVSPNEISFIFKTPFAAVSQFSGKIFAKAELYRKLSSEIGFQLNELSYSGSVSYDVESLSFPPRGFISVKMVTPHSPFTALHVLAEHRKSDVVRSARVAVTFNENKFDIAGNVSINGVRLHLSLPIRGYQNIGFKVYRDNGETQPRALARVQLPHGHYGSLQAAWTYDGSAMASGRLNFETSFERLKSGEVSTNNKIHNQVLEHASSMVINGKQWHDLQLSVDKEKREIKINNIQPVIINYRFDYEKVLISELKVTVGDRVPFHLKTQVEIESYSADGKSFLTLKTPYRTVQLNRVMKLSPKGLFWRLEFTPNLQTIRPLVFDLSLKDNSDYEKNAVLTTMALTVPTRRIEASVLYQTIEQESVATVNLNWDADRPQSKKMLSLKANFQYEADRKVAGKVELSVSGKKPYLAEFSTTLRAGHVLHNSTVRLDITNNVRDAILFKLQVSQEAADSLLVSSSLVQVSSEVNLKINGHVKRTMDMRDGQLSIEYKNSEGQLATIKSMLQIKSNSIRLDLIQAKKQCSFEIKRTVKPDSTAYSLSAHGQKLELLISNAPDVQIIYEPRQNDRLMAAFGYNNRWHLRADVHRVTDKVKNQHLLAEVQQKSKNLLRINLHWNPIDNPLSYATTPKLTMLIKEAKNLARLLQFTCVKDTLANVASNLILPDLSSGAALAVEELQPLANNLGYMRSQFEDMYAKNEFYSYDILRALRKVAFSTIGYATVTVRGGINAYAKHVHPHVKNALNQVRSHADRCYRHAAGAYATYKHHRDRLYNTVNEHVLHYTNRAVDSIRPALDAAHFSYQRFASSYPITSMGEIRTRVARSIGQMDYQSFDLLHADIRNKALSVHKSIEAGINHTSNQAADFISSAQAQVRHHTRMFLSANPISSLVFDAYAKSKWMLDNFNIERNLKDFAKENYHQGVEYVRQNTIGLATDYLGLSKNAILVNNVDLGKFEANLYSPMAWTDLKSLPSSGLDEVHDRLAHSYNSMRHSVNTVRRKLTAVRDVVYDSIPDFDMPSGSWIPKFKGIASVIGDHIITFDGRHFDFRGNGECSYLLARDFRERRWGISMTYSRAGKVMDIFVNGKQIRITPSLHVLVDGAPQELPLNIGNLSIIRSGSGLRARDLDNLFSVTVDPNAEMHTVSVSGWYHGRLGGLFGNFDNEQFNELIDSANRRTTSVLEFTGSWRLGSCRHANLASVREVPEGSHPDCVSLFGSPSSPFRRCYSFVDPAPFRDICAQERSAGGSHQLCRAAVAYIRFCDTKGLRGLQAPTQCVRCTLPSPDSTSYRELMSGQKFTSPAPTTLSADVVLVLEERGCIGSQTLRQLPAMITQLQRSLMAKGVSDIRFGLLGFGNPSHQRGKAVATERSRPHWHTMAGELTGSAEQLTSLLTGIRTHNTADASVNGARGSDALEAVYIAARFGELRPSAARHVILVACDECHEGRRTLKSVREVLSDSNVQLHLLTEAPLPTYFYGRRLEAFGIDGERAFSLESSAGSAELHGYTRRPAGKCAGLASTSGGSIFDLRYLRRHQYSGLSTDFLRSFADRLAAGVTAARAAAASGGLQECLCKAGGYATQGRLTCRPL